VPLTTATISETVTNPARSTRKPELDALRGLFLIWMTLTHLPTHVSDLVNSPFGYISSAEGFVFLSALLVGRVYMRQAEKGNLRYRITLWRRSLRIYVYQLIMLTLLFTFGAAVALHGHHPALANLLNFYLGHRLVAVFTSVILVYCPPLLDILPMYVIFLLLSPFIIGTALRRGWRGLLAGSIAIWILAQFHLRDFMHGLFVHATHLPVPLQELGAFNLFAWQMVWITGMWMGARSVSGPMPFHAIPRWVNGVAAAVCVFFFGVRFDWWGHGLNQQSLGLLLDKWQEGPLRVLNIVAFMCLIYALRGPVRRLVTHKPLITLGMASMEVFCAHLVFVFIGLAMLNGQESQLHGLYAFLLLVFTLIGLAIVAHLQVQRKYAQKEKAARTGAPVGNASWLEGS